MAPAEEHDRDHQGDDEKENALPETDGRQPACNLGARAGHHNPVIGVFTRGLQSLVCDPVAVEGEHALRSEGGRLVKRLSLEPFR